MDKFEKKLEKLLDDAKEMLEQDSYIFFLDSSIEKMENRLDVEIHGREESD